MATHTTNYNLTKPAYADTADIADINGNMDIIDGQMKTNANGVSTNATSLAKVQSGLAYIVGNTNTTGSTLSSGTYVYVKGHSSIAEGLRITTADISNNGNITTSNTSAVLGGGLNSLDSKVDTKTKKLELTSSGVNLDAVLHAWMETHRGTMTTGEMACMSCVFNGTMYYGLVVKVSVKVTVGTMFTPASSNGFRFRDSSDDSSATHTDFTL